MFIFQSSEFWLGFTPKAIQVLWWNHHIVSSMEFMEYHQSHLGNIPMQVELFWMNQNTLSASGGRVPEYVAIQSARRSMSPYTLLGESSNTQHLSLLDCNGNLKPMFCVVRKQGAAEREQTRKTQKQIATLHISLPSPSGIWLKTRAKNVQVFQPDLPPYIYQLSSASSPEQ